MEGLIWHIFIDSVEFSPGPLQNQSLTSLSKAGEESLHQENNTLLNFTKFYLFHPWLVSTEIIVQSVVVNYIKYTSTFKYVLSGLSMATLCICNREKKKKTELGI